MEGAFQAHCTWNCFLVVPYLDHYTSGVHHSCYSVGVHPVEGGNLSSFVGAVGVLEGTVLVRVVQGVSVVVGLLEDLVVELLFHLKASCLVVVAVVVVAVVVRVEHRHCSNLQNTVGHLDSLDIRMVYCLACHSLQDSPLAARSQVLGHNGRNLAQAGHRTVASVVGLGVVVAVEEGLVVEALELSLNCTSC